MGRWSAPARDRQTRQLQGDGECHPGASVQPTGRQQGQAEAARGLGQGELQATSFLLRFQPAARLASQATTMLL